MQNRQPERKSVTEYEQDVYALEHIETLLYAVSMIIEEDKHLQPTLNYICDLLHEHAKRIEEMFDIAIELQKAQNSK